MRHILVPVDFSNVTPYVVDCAVTLADRFGSELHLLHVAAPDPAFVGYETGPESVRDFVAAELRAEHRQLHTLATQLRQAGTHVRAVAIQGDTVATILARAEHIAADVIVIGSHGHGALYRILLGSISEGVLRGAKCPVMVVPAALAGTPSAHA